MAEGAAVAVAPRPWEPLPYMLKAVRWLLQHGGAGLFLDPGLGKTAIVLAALKVLKARGELRPGCSFLVIAPLRPAWLVWPAEALKWSDFRGLAVEVLHGPKKEAALRRRADVYVVNPEGLQWLFGALWRLKLWPFHGLVVDESTTFKRANTERFKLLRGYLPRFKRRWILTGTPAPNGLIDLFGQIYILDLGNALGSYVTEYRRAYFQPTGFEGHTWVPQKDAEKRIYRQIEPLVTRMSEADYLRLPPIVGALNRPRPSLVRVRLPPAARRTYDHLETLFFAELAEGSVTAVNAGARTTKLRQAANGGLYLDDAGAEDGKPRGGPRKWAEVHGEKTEATAELLDELSGKPALVVYDFHHDLARLRSHADMRNVPAMGEGSIREDRGLEARWNAGRLPALFVNAASAHGLNLQESGQAIVFHSLTFNWEHYWQLIKRLWRQGQRRRVFVHHVVAEDTIDDALCALLGAKARTEGALLSALRAYSLRRPRRS